MKSSHLFSFGFDNERLIQDYNRVRDATQLHHNQRFYKGEWSGVAFRRPKGVLFDLDAGNADLNSFEDTAQASDMPHTREVLDFFQCEKTSVRFLKLATDSVIEPHTDERLSFFDGFVRLHIPLITNPDVEFIVDGEKLTMLPGQCWFADFSKTHSVANRGKEDRIHLIVDLKVNDWLHQLFVDEGIVGANEEAPDPMDARDSDFKKATIEALLMQNTETSLKLARDMMQRYKIDLEEKA